MNIALKMVQAGVFAGLLAFAASCSTTSGGLTPSPGDSLASQAGGATDDPAAGFENNQPGSEEDFILSAGRRIYFTEGSAALDETARATVDNQVAFLKKYPRWFAKLQGFADDPGGNAKMVQLSQQRADAVMNYMISSGIAPGRLWAKGYGKERVVRECTERACKVQNRRVITNLRTTRLEPDDGA
jgi:peptidoglycan-associated lipoprotein